MTTNDIIDYSWQYQPSIYQTVLWTKHMAMGLSHENTFMAEDVAGALWMLKHCDGCTIKNGELMCEMDNRAGFGDGVMLITPGKLWACLHPTDRAKTVLYLLIEKEASK